MNSKIFALSLASLPVALLLTGCGMGVTPGGSTAPVVVSANTVSGIVMGGQQPVANVSLQLYAVGTTGYGSAATPLLPPGSTLTHASGNFTLPTFACPTDSSLVYMIGTGGQPIAAMNGSAAVTNNNLAMMAVLGQCSSIGHSFIQVNELTTVASVWALSPFMTALDHVGSSATNPTGIQLAFASAAKLVEPTTGKVSGLSLPANATLPTAEINTLADILQNCVNSGGGSASDTSTPCGQLFALAGGASTTDTVTAAMAIAQNPGANVAALNNLRPASPAFTPALDVNNPPTDWTIAVSYTAPGMTNPASMAADQAGNIFVASPGNGTVTQFAPSGAVSGNILGLGTPSALAVDPAGNVWVANAGSSTLSEISSGVVLQTASGNGLNAPKSIAVDAAGNVYAGNSNTSTISGFTSAGAPVSGSPFTGGGVTSPNALAISPK